MRKNSLFFGALVCSILIACTPTAVEGGGSGHKTAPELAAQVIMVDYVTTSSAVLAGYLVSDGGSSVTEHGFCYAEHSLPTVEDDLVNLGPATEMGAFAQRIDGLKSDTKYYYRAFARNVVGITYSEEGTFTTQMTELDALNKFVLAYYTFDDETATSKAGYTVDGVLFGSPSFISETASGNGKAVLLNGLKGQCVNIPYNLFKGLSAYTISLWLKDFSEGSIVSGISSGSNSDYYCFPRLHFSADGKIAFQTNSSYCNYIAPNYSFSAPCASLQSGAWHHIVVTCNKNTQKLYIDGILTDSKSDNWQDIGDNITKVQIGGNGDGKFPVSFTGKVDNVSLYLTFLLDNQIKYLYDNKL